MHTILNNQGGEPAHPPHKHTRGTNQGAAPTYPSYVAWDQYTGKDPTIENYYDKNNDTTMLN